MTDVRKAASTTVAILIALSLLAVLRNLFLENFLDVTISWIIWGILVFLVGLILWGILGAVPKIRDLGGTAKSILLWGIVLICGLVVHVQFPVIHDYLGSWTIEQFANPELHAAEEFAKSRLMPFDVLGIYVTIFYIAVAVMLFVGVISVIIKGEMRISRVFLAIKMPLIVMGIAVGISFINHPQLSLHRVWGIFLVLAIIGLHRSLVEIMKHINHKDQTPFRKGPLLYISLKNISTSNTATIDKITALVAAALTLLMQVVMVVFVVLYLIVNWGNLQEVEMRIEEPVIEAAVTPAPTPTPTPTPPPPPAGLHEIELPIEIGARGEDVARVQAYLNDIAYFHSEHISILQTDGIFGPRTEGAVLGFQNLVGLYPDGVVDLDTWYKILRVRENPENSEYIIPYSSDNTSN